MTIKDALTFIKIGPEDVTLRRKLLETDGKEALKNTLARENLIFSQAEFEEAYSLSLFKCREPEDAESLMAFRMWWNLLVRSTDKSLEYNN